MDYNEKLRLAKEALASGSYDKETIEYLFPELKETEDERMRKCVKRLINGLTEEHFLRCGASVNEIHAWLEQKPVIDGTFVNVDEVREDFMQAVYKVLDADPTNDRANQIIDAFDHLPTITNHKPTDNTGPKFKVGDVIRAKGGTAEFTIRRVTNTTYYTDGWSYDIESCEEDYELVEQNPTWSEKDEEYLQNMVEWIGCLIDDEDCGDMTYKEHKEFYMKRINWLKSLKERYGWKPTDEQMKQLGWVAEQNKDNMIGKELMSLYQDLKKLKGE